MSRSFCLFLAARREGGPRRCAARAAARRPRRRLRGRPGGPAMSSLARANKSRPPPRQGTVIRKARHQPSNSHTHTEASFNPNSVTSLSQQQPPHRRPYPIANPMSDLGVKFELSEATAGEERPAQARINMDEARDHMEVRRKEPE